MKYKIISMMCICAMICSLLGGCAKDTASEAPVISDTVEENKNATDDADVISKDKEYAENISDKSEVRVEIVNKISYMAPGENYELKEAGSTPASLNWISSDEKIATVDKDGLVTAKTAGTVKISAQATDAEAEDSVTIEVSKTVKAFTQQDIERLLKAVNASTIMIDTAEEVVLTIPKGIYSTKKLIVDAKNATIENSGTFKRIDINAIKSHTWKENAKNNKIYINCNASVVINEGASVELFLNRSGISVTAECLGTAKVQVLKKCNLAITGDTRAKVQVYVNAADAVISASIPVQMLSPKKATPEFDSAEAEKATIKVESGGGASGSTDTPAKPQDTGYDSNGRLIAKFGSPTIDGEIDAVWGDAKAIPYQYVIPQAQDTTSTTATIKVLWDDNAVYFLAQVKDPNVSDKSMQVYEKDSVEFFLDQNNHRNGNYEGEDSQFRINFKNEVSCDHGDLSNLYSATKVTEDGYLVEGRIRLSVQPDNDVVLGMESLINCATEATREACISIFDKTGTAYQDTSKLGEMILKGKIGASVTKPNPYDLASAISEVRKIELERYRNGSVVYALIEEAEGAIADATTTQAQLDELLKKLNKAVDALIHSDATFDDKECREIPKNYKSSATQQGTLECVTYHVTDFQTEKDIEKSMMVYVPYGYNKEDATKKYNVLYLVHGMSENQYTPLGTPEGRSELANVVDHLIAEGKMEPMMIVSPTWYLSDQNNSGENLDSLVKKFRDELVNVIIPEIEGTYHTYAESTSVEDLMAAREHRAFGGFSMGGNCTWYRFIDSLDYFKYFVPVSMWTWISAAECKDAGATGDTDNDIIADYLSKIPESFGYGPDDFYIFGATGTADLASPGMPNQIEAMKRKTDTFKYCGDIRNGNMTFIHYPGGEHNWTCVNLYLYNILPDLFKNTDTWRSDTGLDKDGQMVAKFGSPILDGIEDSVWSRAETVKPQYITTPENTSATFKTLWDDNALYILAKVYDEHITNASPNIYEQDSLEVFMDQYNHKAGAYEEDDLLFRCSFANDTTADKGDIRRLRSKVNTFEGGYIIEARIEFRDLEPNNGTRIGIELQINDGKDATSVGTLNVFDGTGNAWQNTAQFGTVVLSGKNDGDETPYSPYALLDLIDEARKLPAEEYVNWEAFEAIITDSQAIVDNPASTKEQLEEQFAILKYAMDMLEYTEEAAKVKRFTAMPSEYRKAATSGGTIEKVPYTVNFKGENVTKCYNVYLPAGYNQEDMGTKYNVLYLMHGDGENENTLFGEPGQERTLKKIMDNMIEKGKIAPMIVVTPTFYNHIDEKGNRTDDDIVTFYKELQDIIIPQVESTYHTYYGDVVDNADAHIARMKETREHRAFGGFSMGATCTWYTFLNSLDYIKYYIPLCGDCWVIAGGPDNTKSAETAAHLATKVSNSGYDTIDGFKLFCATGSKDISYPNMNPQMQEMEKLPQFVFHQDTTRGNTYFMVADGGILNWDYANQYLYHILPDLFQ